MANTTISGSVGKGGINKPQDVVTVQELINKNIKSIAPISPLKVDGKVGPKTISAIEAFQRKVVGIKMPDGRVDPGGITIMKLATTGNIATLPGLIRFPLRNRPSESYKIPPRNFGANRDNGARLHAGCDLYASVGSEILAMKDGVVIRDIYLFYLGTYALEVDHGDFIARYGEILRAAPDVRKGKALKRGQVIAYVGKLTGIENSMLHLEMYSGTANGFSLSNDTKPYKRRSDLLNPTPYLDKATIF